MRRSLPLTSLTVEMLTTGRTGFGGHFGEGGRYHPDRIFSQGRARPEKAGQKQNPGQERQGKNQETPGRIGGRGDVVMAF